MALAGVCLQVIALLWLFAGAMSALRLPDPADMNNIDKMGPAGERFARNLKYRIRFEWPAFALGAAGLALQIAAIVSAFESP